MAATTAEGASKSGGADTAPGAPAEEEPVKLTDAELVQLQLRVIALEGLVTALLAHAPKKTARLVRALAANIAPRPESTQHHLTVRATAQMVHLLERANVSKDLATRGALPAIHRPPDTAPL